MQKDVTEKEFKAGFSCLASGVGVALAYKEENEPTGFTASSIIPVSVQPPLALLAVDKRNRNFSLFMNAPVIILHLLQKEQAELAQVFATSREDKSKLFPLKQGKMGRPLLKDCLVDFECEREKNITAGDHDLLLLRIKHVTLGSGSPLVYSQRAYHGLQSF